MVDFARETPGVESPAFTTVPELSAGFDLLYEQRFVEAREAFASWESRNPEEPFGEVAVAASYLFEELSRQGVLTSDFFLNEKKFLRGIDGSPDAGHMGHFRDALARARELAGEARKQMRRWRSPSCADACRRNGIGCGIDSAEKASRRPQVDEKS